MKNAFRVLGRDLLRLLKTPAALVVAIVLVVLPSLYTWFNVIGFWDPYNNTGNMRVCVVNEDAGASNDLLGQMNLGDQIVDQLHENTQLKWDFMDYDEAMDEVNSGAAYAAFVIPEDFTSDLMTILTEDFKQPNIKYYVNEKMNPVSPKVTDAGSTTLDETINSQFVSTVSSTVADVMNEKLAEAESDLGNAQTDVAGQLQKASNNIASARTTIADLASEASGAQDKANSAKTQLQQAYSDAQYMEDQLQNVADQTVTLQSGLGSFSTTASSSLTQVNTGLSNVSSNASTSIAGAAASFTEAQSLVKQAVQIGDSATGKIDSAIDVLQDAVNSVEESDALTEDQIAALNSSIAVLKAQNGSVQTNLGALETLSNDLTTTTESVNNVAQTLNTSTQSALQEGTNYQNLLFGSAIPTVGSGLSQMGSSAITLKAAISNHTSLISQTSNVLDQLNSTLATAADALSQTDTVLGTLEDTLDKAQSDVVLLGTSTAVEDLLSSGSIDPEKIADFMQSPTEVKTEKLYPLNAYGSAMAPLFISLQNTKVSVAKRTTCKKIV